MKNPDVKKTITQIKRRRTRFQNIFFYTTQAIFTRRRIIFQIYLVVATIAFAILTILAKRNAYFPIDLKVTQAIQRINLSWFAVFMNVLTLLGNYPESIILIVVAVAILAFFRRYKALIFLVISTYGAYYISVIFKGLVGRVRPDPKLIKQVSHYIRNDSFPSGHVLFYVGFFGFLTFLSFALLKRSRLRSILVTTFIILVSFIGVSRIYRGAHWFSDVMGAYLIGTLWLTLVVYLYNRSNPQAQTK